MTHSTTAKRAHAVFFSVLMVLSVVAVGLTTAPVAANQEDPNIRPGNLSADSPTKVINTSTSGNRTVIFQGEELNLTGGEFETNSILTGAYGAAEDEVLDLSSEIPTDQTQGTYTTTGNSLDVSAGVYGVTVTTPRISTAEVQLDGDDVTSVTVDNATNSTGSTFTAYAEFNFDKAENVSIVVEDRSGADVTSQVTPEGSIIARDGGEVPLELNEGRYNLIFEGSDDLDYGNIVKEYQLNVQNPDSITIDTPDATSPGSKIDYHINKAPTDRYYLITIDESNFDLGISQEEAGNIFVNSSETVEVGKFTGSEYVNRSESASRTNADKLYSRDAQYAYALVKEDNLDETTGVSGSINTAYLDTSQVNINVYNSTTGNFSGDVGELFYGTTGVDIASQGTLIGESSFEIVDEEETTAARDEAKITLAQRSSDGTSQINYTVTGISNDKYHLVTIDSDEFASGLSVSEASNIFGIGNRVIEAGVANQSSINIEQVSDAEYAYALIKVDDSTLSGQINTEYLSGSTADVNLFPAGEGRTGDRLTTPLDTSTVGFPSPEPSYNLTLENDGSVHSVGFPGPIQGDLNDLFVSGTDGINAIYRFNSTTKSWEQQTGLGRSPEELTAIAIVTSGTGPSEIQMKMAFDQRTVAVPGTRSLNTEGWHFVSPSSFDTPGTVFNRGTSRNSLVLDSFEGPQLEIAQTPATFQAQHGSRVYDMRSDNPPVMNPFEGYFVYITRRGDQPALIANADTRYELDSTLNVTYD